MPAERAPMRKIREALRLKHALGLSERPIAMSVGVSRSTIALAGSFHRPAHISGFPPIFCPDSPSCNSSKSRQHFASSVAQILLGFGWRIGMKMITAIIQPFRLHHVQAALSEAGILGVHVTECCGCARQHGQSKIHWAGEYPNNLVPKIMLQLAVPVDQVKTAIEAIIKGARTRQIGDGKIFIAPIDEVIRVRTSERNHQALI